ncbi:MAG: permease-like cell division protein FtsX [Patescibacteria group bacterium]|jgi:cell division transport system permease protein|nr:permease-like cell division protein FtsX [Patescibacteria group bacterium]
MTFYSIYRILAFAWQSFWRNFWLSLVTLSIIVLAAVSINFLLIINVVTDSAIEIIKNKIDVSLYFRPDVTEIQVSEVETYLSSLTQVKDLTYISQQQALENFKQAHKDDPTIIESLNELSENPIGATLQIKAKNIEDYPEIIDIVNDSKYNDLILDKNFDDNQTYIEKIKSFSDNIKTIALFTSGIFIVISLLIVFNTIRVAIYTHRQEIAIMKLVGATDHFIRAPFIIEGAFYGLIALAISLSIIYPFLNLIQPYINNFFLTDQLDIIAYFNHNFWQIFGVELLIIILLNIITSSIAIRRYLKV